MVKKEYVIMEVSSSVLSGVQIKAMPTESAQELNREILLVMSLGGIGLRFDLKFEEYKALGQPVAGDVIIVEITKKETPP